MIITMNGAKTAVVWKQERLIARVPNMTTQVRLWTNLEGSAASPIAIYTPDANGLVLIDLTDYVRTYASVTTFNFSYGSDAPYSNYPLAVTIAGLISPEHVIIPPHSMLQYGALVVPPSMILCDMNQASPVEAELYTNAGTWSVTGDATKSADGRKIGQIDGGAFTLSDGTHSKTFRPVQLKCDTRYALVRWVSFTGVRREHFLEIAKVKTSAEGSYNLLPVDAEYIEVKGRVDGMLLRLTGLDAYDLWYYADMITSSNVQVSLDGTNYDRVQVTTKSITQPDGDNTDGKLEIEINWKRYDAVAM